jgi:PPOX class probable F420-dependent enzyme
VSQAWVEPVRSLLEAPSPAVLTTYRKDGSAHSVPVWYRWTGEAFEVVIAKGDVKLRHLDRNPRCVLVVFEAVRPFRGVEARGVAELVEGRSWPPAPGRSTTGKLAEGKSPKEALRCLNRRLSMRSIGVWSPISSAMPQLHHQLDLANRSSREATAGVVSPARRLSCPCGDFLTGTWVLLALLG